MKKEFFDVEVRSIQRESSSVVSLRLEHPLGEELPEWEAGSHVDVLLPNGILRQYSLCSQAGDRTAWRLGVLREAKGRGGSAYVHDELKPGTKIQVRGPRNNFTLEPAGGYVFIAGGIGITPLLPMVRAAVERGVPWRMVYLGRSRESMAFIEELLELDGDVQIHADDESGLFPLAELLGGLERETHVYACGPGPLLNVLQSIAEGWEDPARFHCERFTGTDQGTPGPSGQSSFVVQLIDGTEISVGPDETILQALEKVGINQANSCREGICGTCETGVLEGEIDHRDSLLSEAEREAGETMMICVSRCKSKRLLLNL
jgi:ferredoxin-NADP reductase